MPILHGLMRGDNGRLSPFARIASPDEGEFGDSKLVRVTGATR